MWYKYFNKSSWQIRIWRNKNLNFKYNDLGFNSLIHAPQWRNWILRVFNSEASLRMFNLFFAITFISGFIHYQEKFLGDYLRNKTQKSEQDVLEREKEEFEKEFTKNRYGVATNPAESYEKFTKFIANAYTIETLGNFVDIPETQKISDDFMTGLDSWIGEEDKRLIEYYKEYHRAH